MQKPTTVFTSLGASVYSLTYAGVFPAEVSSESEGRQFVVTHSELIYVGIVGNLVYPSVRNLRAGVPAPYGWCRPFE